MSHGVQMLLVVLAMALFSTIVVGTYNNLSNQSVMTYRSMTLNQGLRVADRYLQKIGAENISGDFEFDEIYQKYSDYDTVIVCPEENGVNYNVNIRSKYSDEHGDTLTPDPDLVYQRIDIRIWCKPPETDTLHIGTQADPITTLIGKMWNEEEE